MIVTSRAVVMAVRTEAWVVDVDVEGARHWAVLASWWIETEPAVGSAAVFPVGKNGYHLCWTLKLLGYADYSKH